MDKDVCRILYQTAEDVLLQGYNTIMSLAEKAVKAADSFKYDAYNYMRTMRSDLCSDWSNTVLPCVSSID